MRGEGVHFAALERATFAMSVGIAGEMATREEEIGNGDES